MTRPRCPTRTLVSSFILFLLSFAVLFGFILPGAANAAEADSSKNEEKTEMAARAAPADDNHILLFSREDEDGNALSGVVITIYDEDGKALWRGKTQKDGTCYWDELKEGEYSFKETKVPFGEKRDRKEYKLTYEDGKINDGTKLTLGNLTVKLVDEDELEDNDSSSKPDSKPDSNDKSQSQDDAQSNETAADNATKDTTVEKDAADDSELRDGPSYVTSSNNGSVAEDTALTAERPSTLSASESDDILVVITNTAQDGKDNNLPIENAEFTIYDENGKEVYKGLTNSDGELQCYLPAGDYTFKQTFTPAGYKSAKGELKFTVYDNGRVIGDTEIVSQTGSDGPDGSNDSNGSDSANDSTNTDLVIKNVSTLNNAAVIGAEVSFENSSGDVVLKVVSDKEGKVPIDELEPGNYKVYQSKAAEGYYLSSQSLDITIDEDGKITGDTTLKCTPHGTVVITVLDKSTGGVIEGVSFSISDEDGVKVFNGKTGAHGTAAFAVPELGTYKIQETSVPDGYTLNSSSYTFTVKEGFEINGTTTIENNPVSSGRASTTGTGSSNSSSGVSGAGSGSVDSNSDDTSSNSEGVPQTGVTDYTVPLVVVSIALLIIAISIAVLEQRRPDLLRKLSRRKGGTQNGHN